MKALLSQRKFPNEFTIIDTDLGINPNENITKILKPYGVTNQEIYKLEKYLAENVKFNLNRDLRPGKKYALFLTEKDSVKKINYFAYEINPEKYLYVKMSEDTFMGKFTSENQP